MIKIEQDSENNIEIKEITIKQDYCFTLKNKDLVFMNVLDEPDDKGLGRARLVKYKDDIKSYRLRFLPMKKNDIKSFQKKIEELKKLSHDFLLPITDYFEFEDDLGATYMVIEEEYEGTPLSIYKEDKTLNPVQLLCFLCDVFAALEYLHSKEITHWNLNEHTILIKDEKAYVSTYWLSTLLNLRSVPESNLISKENAPLVAPEFWQGFIKSTMSNEVYKAMYKADNFAIVSLFYALYTKKDINLNSKKMAFENTVEWDKLYPKSHIAWFDDLVLKAITSTYAARKESTEILLFLIKTIEFNLEKMQKSEEFRQQNILLFAKEIELEKGKLKNKSIQKEENKSFTINSEHYVAKEKKEDTSQNDLFLNEKQSIEQKKAKESARCKKEFAVIKKSFDMNCKFENLDKFLVVLIGKKLPRAYKNVKNIDLDKSTSSSLEDCPYIQALVESFPNVQFILLNIDDFNISLKIEKAFSYLAKLAASNKEKTFLVYSFWSIDYNTTLIKHVKEQLDICKESGNTLYIASAGNQGLNFKSQEITAKSRFPISFLHDIKLTVGSLDADKQISKNSNRGVFTNYFAYGEDSTLKASCYTLLLVSLFWSHYPDLNAMSVLEKLKEHSVQDDTQQIKMLDYYYTVSLLEQESYKKNYVLKTLPQKEAVGQDKEVCRLQIQFELNLNLSVTKDLYKEPDDVFPLALYLSFTVEDISYEIKITNQKQEGKREQKIGFSAIIDGVKKDIDTQNIKYDSSSKAVTCCLDINNEGLKFTIGANDALVFKSPLKACKIHEIDFKKSDTATWFSNFSLEHAFKAKDVKREVDSVGKKEDKKSVIYYEHSIAVLFIVNQSKNKTIDDFYENVYQFVETLKNNGFSVHILIGEKATYINLLSLLENTKRVNKQSVSRLVFYYYGRTQYVHNDNLPNNNFLTAYTSKEEDEEQLISYSQLMSDINVLPFQHKWTVLESSYSEQLVQDTLKFSPNIEKIKDKCHYLITAKNDCSTRGALIARIMKVMEDLGAQNNQISLNELFFRIREYSNTLEKDKVKPLLWKDDTKGGTFYFNQSKETYNTINVNSHTFSISEFDRNKFKEQGEIWSWQKDIDKPKIDKISENIENIENIENNNEVKEKFSKQQLFLKFNNKEVASMDVLEEQDDEDLGRVRLVQYKDDSKFYRLRFLSVGKTGVKSFQEKIEELKKLSHDLLLPITDYFEFKDDLGVTYLVIEEEYKGVPLASYRKNKILSEAELLCFLADVFVVLEYLHSKEITHWCLNEHTILVKDGKAYVSTYWLSTLLNPVPVLESHFTSKENAPLVAPEFWKGFILSNMTNKIYKTLYKADNFAIVSLFYALYTRNDINSKKMTFEKIVEWDKLYPKSDIGWFDRLIAKTITSTYESKANSKEICTYLIEKQNEGLKLVSDGKQVELEKGTFDSCDFVEEGMKQKKRNTSENDFFLPKNIKKNETEEQENPKKEFEAVKKLFDINYNAQSADRLLVALIGKKLPIEYKNVYNIDFNNTTSSLKDEPKIQAFVESFPNMKFILLNIDDLNVSVKIKPAYDYLAKLVALNKGQNFLVFTYSHLAYDEFLVKYVQEQLDICKGYGNTLYITSAGDHGFDFKNQDVTIDSIFPLSLLHDIKLSIGSLASKGEISKNSNRGELVNYFTAADSTLKAGCYTVLLATLLWSHYPALNAMGLLEEIKKHSVQDDKQCIKKLDFDKTVSLIEKERYQQRFVLKTTPKKDDNGNSGDLSGLEMVFELHSNESVSKILIPKMSLTFIVKNVIYILAINQQTSEEQEQKITFRKELEGTTKEIDIGYVASGLNSKKMSFYLKIVDGSILFKIGNNDSYFSEEVDLNVSKINEIIFEKSDEETYFSNFSLNHFFKEMKCNDVIEIEDDRDEKRIVDYNHSVAVLFIVNQFKNSTYRLFYKNVYRFIEKLKKNGFEIHVLIGTDATHINLLKLFTKIKRAEKQSVSRLVFYYYGHTLSTYSKLFLTAYTTANDEDNYISYPQMINDLNTLPFQHKWTILESCNSGRLIQKPTLTFKQDLEKVNDKCHFFITANKEISTGGILIERIMNVMDKICTENDQIPLNQLFSKISELSKSLEIDLIEPIMLKDSAQGAGSFCFNQSKENYEQININSVLFNPTTFDQNKLQTKGTNALGQNGVEIPEMSMKDFENTVFLKRNALYGLQKNKSLFFTVEKKNTAVELQDNFENTKIL